MIQDEMSPIPEGSVVTEDMLDAWCKHYEIADDVSQRPGVLSSLTTLESGVGELPAGLMNGNEVFYPLMQSYWNKSGNEGDMPEDWTKPLVKIVDHVVTQEDVDLNPGEGLVVGEVVGLPEVEEKLSGSDEAAT